ncbi:MAG: DUF1588 domain-containing protein [Nannocystales bacterium]
MLKVWKPLGTASIALLAGVGCHQGGSHSGSGTDSADDTGTAEGPGSGGLDEASGSQGAADDTSGGDDEDDDDGEDTPSGNEVDQDELFMCDGSPALPSADIRLIDHDEWTRNVGAWYGTNRDRNPFYARAEDRYSTFSSTESVDSSILSLYLDTVGEAGTSWTGARSYDSNANATVVNDPQTLCFHDEASPSAECVRYFAQRYLERGSHFRPATEDEVDRLVSFTQEALADETSPQERAATIRKVAAAAWMSAGALHRTEVGSGELDEHGRTHLTDWELAQAMAYAIGGSAPRVPSVRRAHEVHTLGDVNGYLSGFAEAAEDGTITDLETVRSLVHQYIGGLDEERLDLRHDRGDSRHWDNRGEFGMAIGVRRFFREWLGYEDVGAIPKVEVSETSAWSGGVVELSYGNAVGGGNGYENTLTDHLDDMIARILAEDSDLLAKLLTSRMFYTPATADYQDSSVSNTTAEMSRVYNVEGVTPHTREDRWKELPADERSGVLTHPAWLGAHSLAAENDPNAIHRGKWIREELLCQDIPDIPLTVDAALSEASLEQSARQRMVEQIDEDDYCAGCHNMMNPLGYPFEIYNHAGFVRVEDHGGSPDGSSELILMPSAELGGPVTSALDMSQKFAESQWVKRCFIRQTFRYFAGREETIHDRCTFVALEEAYDDSGGSLAEMLAVLFTSESFTCRVPN